MIWVIFGRSFIGLFVLGLFIGPTTALGEPLSENCVAAISNKSARALMYNAGSALLQQGMLLSDASVADRRDSRLANDSSISANIRGDIVSHSLALTALHWATTFKLRMNLLTTVKKGREKDLSDFEGKTDRQFIDQFGTLMRDGLKAINQTLLLDIYNVGYRRSIENYRDALQSYINLLSPCF